MPFVCPRGSMWLQGVASALVSRIIRGSQRNNKEDDKCIIRAKKYEDEDEEEEDEGLELDDISTSEYSSTLAVRDPWFPTRGLRRPLEPPLRVCSEAHILISNTIGAMAVLPVLPVADAQNIVPLISSVLYQRRVWGINLPVVGLCLSRYDTVARIYVGWLDPEVLTDAGLVCSSCVPSVSAADFVAFGPYRMPRPVSYRFAVYRLV